MIAKLQAIFAFVFPLGALGEAQFGAGSFESGAEDPLHALLTPLQGII